MLKQNISIIVLVISTVIIAGCTSTGQVTSQSQVQQPIQVPQESIPQPSINQTKEIVNTQLPSQETVSKIALFACSDFQKTLEEGSKTIDNSAIINCNEINKEECQCTYTILGQKQTVTINMYTGEQNITKGQTVSKPNEVTKFGFDYCSCGLTPDQTSCYIYKSQCREVDGDPTQDPCIFYKAVTDLYEGESCNPNFNNSEAKDRYCSYMLSSSVDLRNNKFVTETCGIKLPELQPFTGTSQFLNFTACTGYEDVTPILEAGLWLWNADLSEKFKTAETTQEAAQICKTACQNNSEQRKWPTFSAALELMNGIPMNCRCFDCGLFEKK